MTPRNKTITPTVNDDDEQFVTIRHLGTASTPGVLSHQTPRVSRIRAQPSLPSASFLPCVPSLRTWLRLQSMIDFG
jgi:hypothetical protein